MAMRDAAVERDPLAGVELRQAARFAMTLVTEQARVCQRLHRLVELGFPELRRAVRRPHLPHRPGGAAPRAHRGVPRSAAGRRPSPTPTGAPAVDGSARRRRSACRPPRPTRSRCPSSTPEVAFEVGLLLDQYDLLERQIEAADRHVAAPPRRRAGAPAADHPGRRARDLRRAHRRDRRHRPVRRLRPAARLRRRPPRRAQLGPQGRRPRDRLAHEQGRQQPPPGRRLPHGRRRHPAQPGHRRPLRRASARPARAR